MSGIVRPAIAGREMEARPQPPGRSGLLRNVQGLRAFAAMLVVLHHIGAPADGIETHYLPGVAPMLGWLSNSGAAGVDLFFVISGFIMLTTSWHSFGAKGASAKFFLRRLVRIYPPYWLVFFALVAVYVLAPGHFTDFHSVHPDFVASFFLLPTDNQLLFVAWTLVFEMFFYVVFALLLCVRRRFVAPALALWAVAEVILFFTCNMSANRFIAFLGEPLPLEFLFGCAVGLLYVKGALRAPLATLAAGAALFCAALIASEFINDILWNWQRVFLFGIPATLVVYGAVAVESRRGLVVPMAVATVGDASYALYLWHSPLLSALGQQIARFHPQGVLVHLLVVVGLLVAVVFFALGIYRYFERPLTHFLNRLVRDAAPSDGRP